jgi:hypothetical protein
MTAADLRVEEMPIGSIAVVTDFETHIVVETQPIQK